MDLNRMIAELQEERLRLEEAIEALERLSAGGQKRRGRPPKWMKSDGEKTAAAPATAPAPQVKRQGA